MLLGGSVRGASAEEFSEQVSRKAACGVDIRDRYHHIFSEADTFLCFTHRFET